MPDPGSFLDGQKWVIFKRSLTTCWFNEEVQRFKAKGASEDILREPAFTSLLVETVFKKHIEKILSDPAFVEEIILAHCLTASPRELRKMAAQDRERGKFEFAYYLEFAGVHRTDVSGQSKLASRGRN
jgi:hypothetical protein